MHLRCPKCQSNCIRTRNLAKKACAILGTIAGAIAAAISAKQRGCPGPIQRLMSNGDFGRVTDSAANKVLAALVGASTGGVTGARLGSFIDEHLLGTYQCQRCKHKFSAENCIFQDDDSMQGAHEPNRHPWTERESPHLWSVPTGKGEHRAEEEE